MKFKDTDGKELYGYSQVSLDKLVVVGRWIVFLLFIFMSIFLLLIAWGFKNHIWTDFIRSCV